MARWDDLGEAARRGSASEGMRVASGLRHSGLGAVLNTRVSTIERASGVRASTVVYGAFDLGRGHFWGGRTQQAIAAATVASWGVSPTGLVGQQRPKQLGPSVPGRRLWL